MNDFTTVTGECNDLEKFDAKVKTLLNDGWDVVGVPFVMCQGTMVCLCMKKVSINNM